jgi:E3 ubiquitin-protein ligase TRIP12
MTHVATNLKRERLLEDRYTEIDRENHHLLRKMSEAMKKPSAYKTKSTSGPTTLNRQGRKQELLRITKENQRMLKAIQGVQPVYSIHKWERSYKDSEKHLRNHCSYPVITRLPRARSEASVLLPLDSAQGASADSGFPGRSSRGPSPRAAGVGDDPEGVVLKEGKRIGSTYYLLEMSTDGRTLNVSAYDGQTQTSLELIINESKHRQLYRELNGDYASIASRLRVDGDRLVIDAAASTG